MKVIYTGSYEPTEAHSKPYEINIFLPNSIQHIGQIVGWWANLDRTFLCEEDFKIKLYVVFQEKGVSRDLEKMTSLVKTYFQFQESRIFSKSSQTAYQKKMWKKGWFRHTELADEFYITPVLSGYFNHQSISISVEKKKFKEFEKVYKFSFSRKYY